VLHERGVDVSHETVRAWSNWQWSLEEVFVKINGETHYMWCAVDHEGEVLDAFASKRRDRKAESKLVRKRMKHDGRPKHAVTDKLRSCGAAVHA